IYEIDSGTAEIQADPFTPGAWLLLINGVHSSQLIPDEPQRLGFEYMRWIAIALGLRYPQDARLRFLHLGGGGAALARRAEAGHVLAETRPESWDVIIRDVFIGTSRGDHITPGHLTGLEAAETAARALGTDGAYLINYGGPPNLAPARAEAAALAAAFQHVTLISDATMFKGRRRGNIVMIGTQTPLAIPELGGH